jgi:hypothetical protein
MRSPYSLCVGVSPQRLKAEIMEQEETCLYVYICILFCRYWQRLCKHVPRRRIHPTQYRNCWSCFLYGTCCIKKSWLVHPRIYSCLLSRSDSVECVLLNISFNSLMNVQDISYFLVMVKEAQYFGARSASVFTKIYETYTFGPIRWRQHSWEWRWIQR